MTGKKDGEVQDDGDMTRNSDWEDIDDSAILESQQILRDLEFIDDQEDEELEDEIRANLSSKVSSSLHAYKLAGIALIVALVSFTLNTVKSRCFAS